MIANCKIFNKVMLQRDRQKWIRAVGEGEMEKSIQHFQR